MGEPFSPRRHICGGRSAKGHCNRPPTWDGLVYFPQPRTLHRAFACDEHRGALDVARPVDDRSRAEIERRRARLSAVVDDHQPYEREAPLATGREALDRLAAARAYAEQHPEDGWWVRPESRGW